MLGALGQRLVGLLGNPGLKAIGTGGRGFEPWPGLAVPQKLPPEWFISVGPTYYQWPMRLSRVVE